VLLALVLVLGVIVLGCITAAIWATADVRVHRREQEAREAPATLEGGGSHLSAHQDR
jgi:hypothetical protein